MISDTEGIQDFFISFSQADRDWATWIAWVLEEAGYTVIFQDWDFTGNFVLEMDRAHTQSHRTIAVLSPEYLTSRYTAPEWASRFAQDARSEHDQLIPVRVRSCEPTGLLAQIIHVDVVDCDEGMARNKLLKRVAGIRTKSDERPLFPGTPNHKAIRERPAFPTLAPMSNHEFQFQSSGKMEHVVSLILGVGGCADERQATLLGDLRAGGLRPIDPRRRINMGLRTVRMKVSCRGCCIMPGFGVGDGGTSRSDIDNSIRVCRVAPTLWEITTRIEKGYLNGYLIRKAPLAPILVYQSEDVLIEATLSAYPTEAIVQDLSEDPGFWSDDNLKMKLAKLLFRKMMTRNGDEIVFMRYTLSR
jgi:hypothetical protein